MRVRSSLCRAALFVAIAAVVPVVHAQTPPATKVGDAVEVREGDTWSKAKVTGREGRRIQIQYDDGTQEWVTSERIRAPGTAGTPAPAANSADATKADDAADDDAKPDAKIAIKKPAAPSFPTGSAVEVKWGGTWYKAKVTNRRGEWYLIAYDGERGQEWVEPWRVRKIGSSYDIDHASPNRKMFNKIDPPPRDKPGPAPTARGQEAAEAVDWPVTDVDFNRVREVSLVLSPWTYAATTETLPPGRISERSIPLGGGMTNDVHERTNALEVSGASAMLVYQGVFDPKNAVVEVMHMGTGDQVARAEFSPDTQPMAFSPDGKRVAGRGGDKAKGRVDVWDLNGRAEPKHVVSFMAYTASGDFFKDVEQVLMVDATHLITLNTFNGHAIAWEVGPGAAKPIWHAKLPTNAGFELSPDRKTFAVAGDRLLVLGDAITGDLKGSIETSAGTLSSLSFRADGKRLSALSGPTLFEFDLETGKQVASLGLPEPLSSNDVTHLGGDIVAVRTSDGIVAFDTTKRAVLGNYKLDNVQRLTNAADKLVGTTKNDKRRVLCAWSIPMKGAPATTLDTIPTAPGTKVALDLQLEGDEKVRQQVTDALTQQIKDRGWVIGEPAAFRIVGRTSAGKSEQREYGSGPSFGPFAGPRETVTVTQRITRLSVDVDGKSAWATQTVNAAGMMVSRKEGQSIQQAVDEQGKYNIGFLTKVTLPETLFAPIDALPAGVKSYTLANGGIRPN